MYKQGNALERLFKIFISRLSKDLGFSTAEYTLVNDSIKRKDFTAEKYNYEPMTSSVGDNEDYSLNYDKICFLGATYILLNEKINLRNDVI